jgi:hypothetical protein
MKFNIGPNPTHIYEALNLGDSKRNDEGLHHLKRQVFLKPSGENLKSMYYYIKNFQIYGFHLHLLVITNYYNVSENFCCQSINVTVDSFDLSGKYYLNYQKSNSSHRIYAKMTEPEVLFFKR